MKKVMIVLAFGVFTSNAVIADNLVEQNGETDSGVFDGLYVGAGIGGSFLKNKGHTKTTDVTDPENITDVDAGIGNIKTSSVNRFVGNVFVGYGKAIKGKFYLGGELLLELTESKTKAVTKDNGEAFTFDFTGVNYTVKAKNYGFVPELTLKAGYVTGNNMFYAKAGILRSETSLFLTGDNKTEVEMKANEIVPVVYLGFARAFCNRWNASIEVGYQFQQKKDLSCRCADGQENPSFFETKSNVKFNKGWKVRAGVARTFSF